jgi:hypothetical protein
MLHSKRLGASFLLLAMAGLAMAPATFAEGLGPPGGTIYAHDVAYRTIGTPADLPDHGKFDTIYALGGDLANVSDAAPGDRDWNGGRWEVRPIMWTNIAPTQFTNAEDVQAAAEAGDIEIGDVVRRFECPLIKKKGR